MSMNQKEMLSLSHSHLPLKFDCMYTEGKKKKNSVKNHLNQSGNENENENENKD
ncbi:hypothetical protein PFHG_02566 [Plasmodium falciparum HB3]|uniref:Uncharacterized protein n=1 Tax=Plasmodium falciparum (isolate HB3) TaxID=137071 RepID=A0A0L7KBK8_PLAFX|nr:hypothetical protein PFHG_02566 [Plasmodium falciparum HB3]